MKKIIVIVVVIVLIVAIGGVYMFSKDKDAKVNTNVNTNNTTQQVSTKRTAKNSLRGGESIQTEDKDKATRVVPVGAKIK